MKFHLSNYDDFLKERHKAFDLTNGIPKTWLLDPFDKFIYVIQNTLPMKEDSTKSISIISNSFYTSQGSSHLTFLTTCIGVWVRWLIRFKSKIAKKYVFHFGLIKLLVLEELKKTNRDWNTFLFLENYDHKVVPTPSKRVSSTAKPKETPTTSSKKRKG